MWPRETTARSGDIVGGIGSPPAKANVFGLCSGEHRCSCRSEKHEVFGCQCECVRSGSQGAQQIPDGVTAKGMAAS
jgi:hypothetical protein